MSRSDAPRFETADTALLAGLRRGDEQVFDAVVTRFHPELHAYVTRWTGSEAIAWDVLQEMFLRLWHTRTTVDAPHGLRAYLYAATRGYVLRYLRSERRIAQREAAYAAEQRAQATFADADSSDSSDATLMADDAIIRVAHGTVEQFPERMREVWRLCREQGLSYPEAAAVLGVSVNTVKTQLARALRLVRAAVAPLLSLVLVARAS